MRAWDFTLIVPHRSGTVATLGEEFGKAGINIEGICGFEHDGKGIFHVLVTDREGTRRVVEKFGNVGFEVTDESEVLVERIENRPGVLGEYTRRIADQDINLTTVYMATDTRLVLGAADVMQLEKAWQKAMAGARN